MLWNDPHWIWAYRKNEAKLTLTYTWSQLLLLNGGKVWEFLDSVKVEINA